MTLADIIRAKEALYPTMQLYGEDFVPWSDMSAEPLENILYRDFSSDQKKFIEDDSQFQGAMGSRGTGKSTSVGKKAADFGLNVKRGTDVTIAAPSLRQAILDMRYCKEFLKDTPKKKETETEIILAHSDVSIMAVPDAPKTVRSRHGPVIVDEGDAFRNVEEMMMTLYFMAAHGHPIINVGTPMGHLGILYKIFGPERETKRVKELEWSRHVLHYSRCPFMDDITLEFIRSELSELAWRQEMEMEFLDDNLAWLPMAMIKACCEDYQWPCYEGPFVRAADLAAVTQSSYLDGIRIPDQRVKLVNDTSFFNKGYEAQLTWLRSNKSNSHNMTRFVYDATGNKRMSEEFHNLKREQQWSATLYPVTFDNRKKRYLMEDVRMTFERCMYLLPLDNRSLQVELNSIRRTEMAGGLAKFEGKGTFDGQTHHADKAWTLAMLTQGLTHIVLPQEGQTVESMPSRTEYRHKELGRGKSGKW